MQIIKSFDIYQSQSSSKSKNRKTLLGGLVSLSTIPLVIILVAKSVYRYFSPIITHDAIIHQSPQNEINVNISIFFPAIPCNLISLDQSEKFEHTNDADTISKIRVFPNNTHTIYNEVKNRKPIENLFRAIKNQESCKIIGSFNITKISGDFHFSFHDSKFLWNAIKKENDEEFLNKIQMNHKLNLLYFGDSKLKEFYKEEDLSKYNINTTFFYKAYPNFINDRNNNYEYYLKIIPYIIYNKSKQTSVTYYQYSMNVKKVFREDTYKIPYTKFFYEFSTIGVRVTLTYENFGRFLTHLCAIIGGVYAISRMVIKIIFLCKEE